MKKISVFDTTISDYNLGNEIIMQGVYKHLKDIFPHDFFYKLPYMEITRHTKTYLDWSDLVFFGGTNSLTSRMEYYKQWGLGLSNFYYIKGVVLMGIGWWQYYHKRTSLVTRFLLKNSLSDKYCHSVRDSYTEKKLRDIGINNVINTGCPTLWDLTEEHCKTIKKAKSDSVIITFTDYHQKPDRDKVIFDIIQRNYKDIYVWPQGSGDMEYIKKNISDNVIFLDPNLESFDKKLYEENIDYIGTRLHAGIRALQLKRRAIIIGIDNRANEMKKDFNLPVLPQENINELSNMINSDIVTKVTIPIENINKWKSQFK